MMTRELKIALANFELKEKRKPTKTEIANLKKALTEAYQKSTLTGCSINYL